jgi:hypothetical protein
MLQNAITRRSAEGGCDRASNNRGSCELFQQQRPVVISRRLALVCWGLQRGTQCS